MSHSKRRDDRDFVRNIGNFDVNLLTWQLDVETLPKRIDETRAGLDKLSSVDVPLELPGLLTELKEVCSPLASYTALIGFTERLNDVMKRERMRPDGRFKQAGSAATITHRHIERVLAKLQTIPAVLVSAAEPILEELARTSLQASIKAELESAVKAVRAAALNVLHSGGTQELLGSGRRLHEAVKAVLNSKDLHFARHGSATGNLSRWKVVIVEDDPASQRAIIAIIPTLQRLVADVAVVTYDCYGDHVSALKTVLQVKRKHRPHTKRKGRGVTGASGAEEPALLAVLDLGLPYDASSPITPDEGLALLEEIRDPRLNVPSVILTTGTRHADDHRRAFHCGVSTFLLKESTTFPMDLLHFLEREIVDSQIVEVAFVEEQHLVVVNEVDVPLTAHAYRLLRELADARGEPMVDRQLAESLRRVSLAGNTSADRDTLDDNLRRNWAAAKLVSGNPVASLRNHNFRLWRDAIRLAGSGFETQDATLSEWLDLHYGSGHRSGELKPNTIQKYVSEVRQACIQKFSEVGRHIGHADIIASEEALSGESDEKGEGYRFVAREIPSHETRRHQRTLDSRNRRVLVFEDAPELENEIVPFLRECNCTVDAVGSFDAVREHFERLQPNLACVHLNLPLVPGGPEVTTPGIEAIKLLRQLRPDLRVLVLTDLGDDDRLHVAATAAGARGDDIIKKSANWKAELLARLGEESGPVPWRPFVPLIKIVAADADHLHLLVNGEEWILEGFQARALKALADAQGQAVDRETLIKKTYGARQTIKTKDGPLTQLIGDLRTAIAKSSLRWFGVDDTKAAVRISHQVIKKAGAGYRLRAWVVSNPGHGTQFVSDFTRWRHRKGETQ